MKITFVLFLFFLSVSLSAQDKWTIDLIAGPEYGNSRLNASLGNINESSGKWGYRLGFNFNRRLISAFWLKTGLRWTQIGYIGEKSTGIKWGTEFDHDTGEYVLDPTLPHELQVVTDFYFVELPVVGRWEFGHGRIIPFLELGISPHFYLMTKKEDLTDLGSQEFYDRTAPDLSLAGSFSLGVQASLSNRLSLLIQPITRYHFSKKDNTVPEDNLYTYGMEVGIRMRPCR
ncbi:MAG: hypothetical protein R2824_09290 [Saprospiraceae bacterium]|nr:hypothetical protein [Lewinella sp.]